MKARAAKPTGRQGIWAEIRRLGRGGYFTVSDIRSGTDIATGEITSFLVGLVNEGILSKTKRIGGSRGSVVYGLLRDTGSEAPVIGPAAKLRDTLWNTMKMLSAGGDFSVRDLAISARTPGVAVHDREARAYIGHLVRARYIAETSPGRFLLVQYTGPRAPIAQRLDTLFDPNVNAGTGAVVWHSEADK